MLLYGHIERRGYEMLERDDLLASIAHTIRDYRAGEIPEPTPEHVDRWIRQFDGDVQVPMLRELDYVFKRTYVPKSKALELFGKVVANFSCDFWRASHILSIQENGNSQAEIRELVGRILKDKCGSDIGYQGAQGRDFVYLDDAIFTGDRVIQDLSACIRRHAPDKSKLHIVAIATHEYALYQIKTGNPNFRNLKEQKQIELHVWSFDEFLFENRRADRNQSDVLWPVDGVYESELFQPRVPQPRVSRIFSSEQGRQLLEREFLNAGLKIQGFSNYPNPRLKPLGFSPFNPGFGSLFVTFRNCPNNCPLAFWYGDPSSYPESHPLGRWYPLFPRKGYSQ